MRFRTLFPLLPVAAVAACVAPPRPAPPAPSPPVVVATPAPPPAPADWRDRPYAAGDWRHLADATRPAARYQSADGTMLFALNCDRPTRTISVALPGPAEPLTIRTTSATRMLAVRVVAPADAATLPTIIATLAATDPLLDAMAFSRGRFSVEQPGRPPLVLPAWAEIGRLIDDCRR